MYQQLQLSVILILALSVSLLLVSLQAAAAASSSNDQLYAPVGHGKCHDSRRRQYTRVPVLRHKHHHPDFQSFYELPRRDDDDDSAVRHLNSVSRCDIQCRSYIDIPSYRGYEIVVGRGCHCLFDAQVKDAEIANRESLVRSESYKHGNDNNGGVSLSASGRIVGSDESYVGYYCYEFIRDNNDGENSIIDDHDDASPRNHGPAPASTIGKTAAEEERTKKKMLQTTTTTYEPVHLLVGKGSCHDANKRTYPYILQSTDGSNRKCRERCNLATPLDSYRGYENYPREKKCACLYDASFTTRGDGRTYDLEGGGGGEGNIKGTSGTRDGFKEAYCYKFHRIMKKVAGPNGRVNVVDVERVEERTTVVREVDDNSNRILEEREEINEGDNGRIMSVSYQEVWNGKTDNNAASKDKEYIHLGKGLCADSQSRIYPSKLHDNMGNKNPDFNCRSACSQYKSNPYYRGYEETSQTNWICKCLFDHQVTKTRDYTDEEYSLYSSLTTAVPHGIKSGGEGEIRSTVNENSSQECFKYIGRSTLGNEKAQFMEGSTPEKYTYELVGEGICVDKNGGWFDAVEFRDTIATDCPIKCAVFTMFQNYRGIEVTLSNVCFCLFDDGTILNNAKLLNYGKGKGEIMGVDKKEGTSGPFCFRLKSDKGLPFDRDDDDEDLNLDYHEEALKYKMRREAQGKTAGSPVSQPTSTDKGDSTYDSRSSSEPSTEPPPHTYNSIFVPHQTQYDHLRFDPYSFSGAPLGGWGRDTRNRLASLPIRLVHGFDGNWNEIKSGAENVANDDEVIGDADMMNDLSESSEMEIGPDGSQVSRDNNVDSPHESTAESSKEVVSPASRPPHFIIHDGTGQKYICRVYYDDELVVVSRMDSMFLPATTIEENGGTQGTFDVKESEMIDKPTKQNVFNLKIQGGGKTFVQISSDGIDINGESLEDTISSAVTKMLNNLGLGDDNAMADLAAMADQGAVEQVEDVNAWLTEIGMAAAVGAGVNGAAKAATSAGIVREEAKIKKLSYREILDALDSLKGVCSQAHLGWWSYEWCHFQEVKQFHVGVVNQRGGGGNGNQVQFEIQDTTLIGHYDGRFDIVYPASKRHPSNDEEKGTTMTMQYDSHGNVLDSDIRVHPEEEFAKWQASHKENEVIRNYYGSSNFNNRGPIIKHTFVDGDMCDEVGRPREIAVDMRCCTEDEMLKWVKSITRDASKRKSLTKKDLPKAAIVGLAESKTEICTYQAHVCTPALCPDQSEILTTAKPKEKKIDLSQTNLVDALDTASGAIASTLTNLIGENLDVEDVEVYFGNEENAALLEEVLNNGANPAKLQGLVNQFFKKVEPSKKLSTLEMKEGESVRELLDRTLGKKPCLKKNLGWWTYEYCHNNHVIQYHGSEMIDTKSGQSFTKKETSHLLGLYKDSGNSISDYPNEEEHLHVVNATGTSSEMDLGRSRPKPRGGNAPNQKTAGGNGAVYVQEWSHGDTCDHDDVAESVIKGGNIVQGSVERSTTVRFSCGKTWELVDINEDSTCHYVVDVSVPELCQHPLFKAPVIKTQVVKCLPV